MIQKQNSVQAIDPSNPPPGMFMILVIDRMNDEGLIETTVQGKIDEPYSIECLQRGIEVLKQHHAKIKHKDNGEMKILGVE